MGKGQEGDNSAKEKLETEKELFNSSYEAAVGTEELHSSAVSSFSHFPIEPVIFLFECTCAALKPFPHVSLQWLLRIRSEMRGLFLPTRG